jgi:hypothetical protein
LPARAAREISADRPAASPALVNLSLLGRAASFMVTK